MSFFPELNLVSAIPFFLYGLHCLFSKKMVLEFERYGLAKFRVLTGILEISGALGQIIGLWVPQISLLASLGLTLLMICGVGARWRIKDPIICFIPAVALGLVNALLVWMQLK